jgi:hypothetical protein
LDPPARLYLQVAAQAQSLRIRRVTREDRHDRHQC